MAKVHPIGCVGYEPQIPSFPPEEARKRGLYFEHGYELNLEREKPYADLFHTGHAPFGFPEGWGRSGRLNIGALDPEWRDVSMRCLRDYIEKASRYPNLRLVNMHAAPRYWTESYGKIPLQTVAEYAYLIDNLRELADYAAGYGITITVENNRAYWDGIPDTVSFDAAKRSVVKEYFGSTAPEWLQIWRDVAKPNLFLCLDTSHATTISHRIEDLDERRKYLWSYISEPEALRHIHWNENDPWNAAGRQDRHLELGTANLGREFNRAISKLSGVSFMIEHFVSLEQLDRELAYIESL